MRRVVLTVLLLAAASRAQTAAPTPAAAVLSAPVGDVVLAAEQSTGGALKRTPKGDLIGVVLNRSCETNFARYADACIEWPLPTPLPAGWWHVQAESAWKGYATRDFGIELVSAGNPALPVNDLYWFRDEAQRAQPIEGWVHAAGPVSAVRLKPSSDIWRWNETWPVSRVVLDRRPLRALDAADLATLALPVAPDGSVALPLPLPPGNCRLNAVLGKKGKDSGVALFGGADGRAIEAPITFDRYGRGPAAIYTYTACPFTSLAIRADYRYTTVVLQHKPTHMAAPTRLASEAGELTQTVDPARMETARLELRGANLTGEPPRVPLYPQGKKIAVLTSWDDGKPEDVRCAEILNRQGYHPSFFMNNNSPAMQFLDKLEALNVEVGSHCFNHPSLYTIPPLSAAEECVAMRKVLERKLGHPVISFGYPNGYAPARDADGDYVVRAVRAAGYWSCRTTATAQETVESSTNLLVMKTDGFFGNAKDLERTWQTTRTKEGGVFSFWGHSWQIGKTDEQWKGFEDFVAQFARQPDAWYPSQGEFSLWIWARRNVRWAVTEKSPSRVVVDVSRPWLHPYLAARCPFSLQVPAGVQEVVWRGKSASVSNGAVDLVWGESAGPP